MTAATDLEQLLKAGIAAYQQGDYEAAIASLSALSRTSNRTYRTKAGMGLVRVYMAQQDWAKAKPLCQTISQSSKPAVQQWATTTLDKIETRMGRAEQSAGPALLRGFQPFADDRAEDHKARQNDSNPPISMFHYAYLNGEAIDEATVDESADLAAASVSLTESDHSPMAESYEWPYAGRLNKGRSLGKLKKNQQWAAQIVGAVAFYGLLHYSLSSVVALINRFLVFLDRLLPVWVRTLPSSYSNPTVPLLAGLGIIALASPWLWDFYLSFTASRAPFSINQLRSHSAEASALLTQQCRLRRWPLPALQKLPTEVPLIFSYGWLPRNARLVISEGVLTQLKEDEIAALVAYELSHWKSGYWPLLSVQGLVLQVFYQMYWSLSAWGNARGRPLRLVAGTLAMLSYCAFWLLRLPGLWISRVRTYRGDRTATEATGNPNGLARALSKLAFAQAASVERQGYTPALLESAALLLSVSPRLADYRLYGSLPLAQLFAWDSLNPLSDWLSLNQAHPPLGDRLRLLMAYAQHWKLERELPLSPSPRRRQLSQADWLTLIAQGTPFFGLALGLAIGLGLWLLGALGLALKWPALDWMYRDTGLFSCCLLMGSGIGSLLRINRFFPDLSLGMPLSQDLAYWLSDPHLLPANSLSTKLSGTLIGKSGLDNWLGQDLWLTTSTGLLRLHFFSALGPLGNLTDRKKLTASMGKSVQILGWFRRGHQPWLDIDKIRMSNGVLIQAAHPICSLLLAVASCGLGLWLLIKG
jgi:Zn-dependent protease with chaperone function